MTTRAKFSRRHYEAIAATLATVYSNATRAGSVVDVLYQKGYQRGVEAVVAEMADIFEDDNPNFDRYRFIKACEVRK